MVSFLSMLDPVPAFPKYTGPYEVGSVECEIPIEELQSPYPPPDNATTTVHFRIFYPCDRPDSSQRPVRWVPSPQRSYISAVARFIGLKDLLADLVSLFDYITIPVSRCAPLSPPPTTNKRWPLVMFSHGLGGSLNAYSHFCGSLASHGMIVVASDHRDGSAPLSMIRPIPNRSSFQDPEKGPSPSDPLTSTKRFVTYKNYSHEPSKEVLDARNQQLRVRLWELALIYEALVKLDQGQPLTNLSLHSTKSPKEPNSLPQFAHSIDIHRPGAVSWAGHSFGSATMIQLVKSVYYHDFDGPRTAAAGSAEPDATTYVPLFKPSPSSSLVAQITPRSPVLLLDPWSMPLRSESTRWLWNKPMPTYAAPSSSQDRAVDSPRGANLLAVLSEAFYKWEANMSGTRLALSRDPGEREAPLRGTRKHGVARKAERSAESDKDEGGRPMVFYPTASAHLSQSDFGVLFPWLTRKAFKADEPERTLWLNVRACLEVLRRSGWEISGPRPRGGEGGTEKEHAGLNGEEGDWRILEDGEKGGVKGWVKVDWGAGPGARTTGEAKAMEGSGEGQGIVDAVVDGEVLDRERG